MNGPGALSASGRCQCSRALDKDKPIRRTKAPAIHPEVVCNGAWRLYLFNGVRPSSGVAGLHADEIWQSSGIFGVESLLLPRTAALQTLNA